MGNHLITPHTLLSIHSYIRGYSYCWPSLSYGEHSVDDGLFHWDGLCYVDDGLCSIEMACVTERTCQPPAIPRHVHRVNCREPFLFNSICQFECDAGYALPTDGVSLIQCVENSTDDSGPLQWNNQLTSGEGTTHNTPPWLETSCEGTTLNTPPWLETLCERTTHNTPPWLRDWETACLCCVESCFNPGDSKISVAFGRCMYLSTWCIFQHGGCEPPGCLQDIPERLQTVHEHAFFFFCMA